MISPEMLRQVTDLVEKHELDGPTALDHHLDRLAITVSSLGSLVAWAQSLGADDQLVQLRTVASEIAFTWANLNGLSVRLECPVYPPTARKLTGRRRIGTVRQFSEWLKEEQREGEPCLQ